MLKWNVYFPFIAMITFFAMIILMFIVIIESADLFSTYLMSFLGLLFLYLSYLMFIYFIAGLTFSMDVKDDVLQISMIKIRVKAPFALRYYLQIPFADILQITIEISRTVSIHFYFKGNIEDELSKKASDTYQVLQWKKQYDQHVIRKASINILGLTKTEYTKIKEIINFAILKNNNLEVKVTEGYITKSGHW